MKRIDFVLGEKEIIEIVRIMTDSDRKEALRFLASYLENASQAKETAREISVNGPACYIIVEGDSVDALQEVVDQSDEEEGLAFLHAHFEREIKRFLTPCCVPVFEVSYKPNQADHYATNADSGRTA